MATNTQNGVGSNPAAYRYQPASEDNDDDDLKNNKPLPIPWWFNPETAKLYHNLSVRDTDIIVSSGVKMGTTWVSRILVSLLYEYDSHGKLIPEEVERRINTPGRYGQTYPDALYATRKDKQNDSLNIYKRMLNGEKWMDNAVGDYVYDDILNQPEPRLFVSHLFGKRHLPKELFDDVNCKRKGKGKLIVVLRNLKDTLVSLHNFRGTPKDGWLGNEHGPGSFHRFIDTSDDCPNMMGNTFNWIKQNSSAVDAIGNGRALVIYYENLILDFDAELNRINTFLGLEELTEAKCRAIQEACSIRTMKSDNGLRSSNVCRKGGIGGWKDITDLNDEHWIMFDKTFESVLGEVKIAQPMREFHKRYNISNETEEEINARLTSNGTVVDEDKAKPTLCAKSRPKVVNKQYCQGVPMPSWYRRDAWQLYRNLNLQEDDIILSSGVKMGTTWVTKILNCLLWDVDNDGQMTEMYMNDSQPNRLGQTYPEAMPPNREIERQDIEAGKGKMIEWVKSHFGDFTVDDLINQPSPRLFSSHIFGKTLLPKQLFDGWIDDDNAASSISNGHHKKQGNTGKGRLIVVVRNLKDSLVSLHHFMGVPKDGWLGNEHGPGSFGRWLDDDSPNAYGNAFQWVKKSAEAVDAIGDNRALVVHYEALKTNFDVELKRINKFLGLDELTEAKARTIRQECSAQNMKSKDGDRFKKIVRKGDIGDWRNYSYPSKWDEIDREFERVLGSVEIALPMREYQKGDVDK